MVVPLRQMETELRRVKTGGENRFDYSTFVSKRVMPCFGDDNMPHHVVAHVTKEFALVNNAKQNHKVANQVLDCVRDSDSPKCMGLTDTTTKDRHSMKQPETGSKLHNKQEQQNYHHPALPENQHQRNSPVQRAITRLAKVLDDLHEQQRTKSLKEKLSFCLIQLQAAIKHSELIRSLDNNNISSHQEGTQKVATAEESSLEFEVMGDYGLALFSPLTFNFMSSSTSTTPCVTPTNSCGRQEDDNDASSEETDFQFPLQMVMEPSSVTMDCPHLLTIPMLEQLVDALPLAVKMMTWRRIFAIGRDGDSFDSMLRLCNSFPNTVLVVETTDGHILGGYAACCWEKRGNMSSPRFYGTGQSFLFCTHPAEQQPSDETNHDELHIYDWSGKNNYFQVCNVEKGEMAMGGGAGGFALIVNENFSRGSTCSTPTFNNPALVPGNSVFDILNFEIYGFSPMAETLSMRDSIRELRTTSHPK